MDDYVTKLRGLEHGANVMCDATSLDARTAALVQVSALIASGAAPAAYVEAVHSARSGGVTENEIVDTLIAVSTTVGSARVVSAARGLSVALGYDIDAALEGR